MFPWEIPANWKVDAGPVNPMATGWNQVFAIVDGTLTCKLQKFGLWVQRTTDNVITTGP